jgi:hypothetical protein
MPAERRGSADVVALLGDHDLEAELDRARRRRHPGHAAAGDEEVDLHCSGRCMENVCRILAARGLGSAP